MTKILNEFKIFDTCPKVVKEVIKIFFAFFNFAICVTNDDKVYAFGEKYLIKQYFGYSEENIENNYLLISELCDQNIQQFYCFKNCLFARSFDHKIFGSGYNNGAKLARGYASYENLRPRRIEFFDNKIIFDISCGYSHCLALSSEGLVYGWGSNEKGQFDDSKDSSKFLSPVLINTKNKVKHIHSMRDSSVLVSFDGFVYILNPNEWHLKCKLSLMSDVSKIYLDHFSEKFIVLKNNSKVQHFSHNEQPLEYNFENITEVQYFSNSKENQLIIANNEGIQTFDLKIGSSSKFQDMNAFEFCLIRYQSTFTAIHLNENGIYFQEYNEKNNILFESMKKIDFNINEFNQKYFNQDHTMSMKKFRIFNALPDTFESKVKFYHQIGDYLTHDLSAIYVMTDNKVYAMDYSNKNRVILGLGQKLNVEKYTIIEELCDQNIEEFFDGKEFMFGRSDKNRIFGWGKNDHGQLTLSNINEKLKITYVLHKPTVIEFFENKNIIEISCGSDHCLGLSEEGVVYGWGGNHFGQTGSRGDNEMEFTPIKLELSDSSDNRIKFIKCGFYTSCAVTVDGTAYLWGRVNGIKTVIPIIIETKVAKLFFNPMRGKDDIFRSLIPSTEYSILTTNEIFKIHINQEPIFEYKEITDLFAFNVIEKEDVLYEFNPKDMYFMKEKQNLLIKTEFTNSYEYYLYKYNKIESTLQITNDGYLKRHQIQVNYKCHPNSSEKFLKKIFVNIFDAKFVNSFDIIERIGVGGFGVVYKAKHKSTDLFYAIKRMQMRGDFTETMRELQIISQLNSEFVVKYYNSWTEAKIIDKEFITFAYIQMEMCSQNLKTFIDLINTSFDHRFKTIKYFIRSELFIEIIECLNHLHSSTPPIIHRDLKPENLLVTDGTNGRFLKLCDFGLSKVYENTQNSRGMGTKLYMAPEVFRKEFYDSTSDKSNYDLKSDIYSLGVIATKLFDMKDSIKKINELEVIDKYSSVYSNTSIKEKYRKMFTSISLMLSKRPEERLSCSELLDKTHEWTVDTNTVINNEFFKLIKEFDGNSVFNSLRNYLKFKPFFIISRKIYPGKVFSDQGGDKLIQNISTNIISELNQDHSSTNTKIILKKYSEFIKLCIYYIRNKEPEETNDQESNNQDQKVNQLLMPSFRKMYKPVKTTPNGSCFYNAISLILFKSEDYSNTIRLLTFDTIFRFKEQFTEYCERIGEEFSNILIKITQIKSKTEQDNNCAEDPSIIATHIAIERPLFIFGGFIDKRKTVVITENVNEIEFNTIVENENFGWFYKDLSMINCQELGNQFTEGCLGTTASQCVNLSSDKRPICLYLEDNHFTALLPRSNFDPFIPTNMSPHSDFLDCFYEDDLYI